MAKVEVGQGRSTIEQVSDGLRITIPSRKNFFLIIFLAFWLMGWAVGEVLVLRTIFDPKEGSAQLFLIVWLCGWSVGGIFAIYAWLWNVMGKEIIEITSAELKHIKSVVGFNRSKEYSLTSMSNLRVKSQNPSAFNSRNGMEYWGIAGGSIAFDYGRSTHRFGVHIDEAEANHIVETIKGQFKNL